MTCLADHRWLPVALLLSWCGFLFFYGLDSGELYRTESLRAVIAQEALRDGNWTVPTLYGQPLLTKPPGMYVAIALVSWPIGEVTQWSARLPSAIAATATVFLFYWYFYRFLGRWGGLVAGAILPASLFWLDKAPSAEIDMVQVAWVSAAVLLFLRYLETSERPPRGFLIAALLCVAGGFLTKWTAPAFFYLTAVPLLWWRRRVPLLWGRDHLLAAGLAGSLCLAWAATTVAQVGWDTLWTTVRREAVQHLSPAHHQETVQQLGPNHQHRLHYGAEAALFPFQMLGMALPWSLLALLTMRPSFFRQLDERTTLLWQGLHCWVWPNLLLWTVLPDPSPRHAAPLLPALAGLAALALWCPVRAAWGQGPSCSTPRRWATLRWGLPAFLVCWVGVKIVYVEKVLPDRAAHRQPREKAGLIAAELPAHVPLYLFRVKDEGIMFYTGRVVRRVDGPEQLPSSGELVYCMLMESEWANWPTAARPAPILRLRDQQGAPILLVKVAK